MKRKRVGKSMLTDEIKPEGAFPQLPEEKRFKPYRAKGREPGYDGAPPEFLPKRGSEVRNRLTGEVVRQGEMTRQNTNRDRVTYLFHHGMICERQYNAAERLQRDWELSEILPVASSVLVGATSGTVNLPNDQKVAAMKRFGAARDAVGVRFWPIINKVVLEHKSIGLASTELHIHEKRAVERLDNALDALAVHYRLPG